ncbi:multisubunit sodium/proton antiporter, MrpA subunit /multisubunit sodium/proton antiporter, MrpB subunit [Kytococcus aerolatus]|uniref:Multisubunit sodium/proton antiporter, MrpA subunit /multisubunit sodium/proton antiporter, MrpB subunit n=1 Tax=Kytococcus aerolatus TaxID=592308 RepID=A0A212U548_9MICO|nr:Na+/H+ antiporter subunit A [Kytococcus aerolatus]SNC73378.1 multisubunit sodium/proton antiporter, MrpA subunit /multisubunit sodium/proton antiporter, MrpB subunit [Kytococcus aerolatus]
MIALVTLHLVAGAIAPLLVRLLGPRAFWPLALAPAATAGWALTRTRAALSATPPTEDVRWVPTLQMDLSFRLDALGWLMTVVVGVVGTLVLLYCSAYFRRGHPGLGAFAASLTVFAGAMVGLVLSDDVLMLYIFWEITTVLSYLLVAHTYRAKASRVAASQALIVTTFGGLAMLVGLLLLAHEVGSTRLSDILAASPSGPVTTGGVLLVLVGALSKSAIVPFHFWLPGAMAAPTPVSAFLHSAAMVKAGVYLVARLAPTFAELPVWRWTVLVLGGTTMLLGAWRALRQYDLKLLLAYGTVSQLGFLVLVLGLGTADAALAGLTLLLSHALFKSALFMAVGVIDQATGTRDVRLLRGLRHSLPVTWWTCLLALASMAGIPPFLGFVAKEAVYGALWHGGPHGGDPLQWAVLAVAVLGSALTLAYSGRFLVVGLGSRDPEVEVGQRTPVKQVPPLLVAVPGALALAGLVAAPLAGRLEPALAAAGGTWPASRHPVHLGLWHGLTMPLLLTVLTITLGALLVLGRRTVTAVQVAAPDLPTAQDVYRRMIRQIERGATEVTGFLQRGSLELNLALVFGMLVLLPGGSLLVHAAWPEQVRPWDVPAQFPVAVAVAVAAVAAARSRRRLRGVFLLGVTGYGVALLFLLHGAPDLALTQILVETVSIAVFVLVLRRLPTRFVDESTRHDRRLRAALGVLVGATVTGLGIVASGARVAPPASVGMAESAYEFGGGHNVVNVILVDIRAWDTMGELSVVLVAATGVASLVFLHAERTSSNVQHIRRVLGQRRRHALAAEDWSRWIPAPTAMPQRRRSLMLEVVTRLLFHTIMVWSVYLLLAGHNAPGGGFAAGLVAGLAIFVRYLAGGREEMQAALPVVPGVLLGLGLFLSAGTGLFSMLVGGEVLQTWVHDLPLGPLGEVHVVTSVVFDVGVYLVVVGLLLDILTSLGASLDREIDVEREARA